MSKRLHFGLVILFSLLLGFILAKVNWKKWLKQETENNNPSEWVQLFNGKDFEDWNLLLRDALPEEFSKVYTIDDNGILHFFRDIPYGYGSKNRKNATHGVMATKKTYRNFHLKFEYKWGEKLVNDFADYQYDAGVFYHISKLQVFPRGYQYQVRYDHLKNVNYTGEIRTDNQDLLWYSIDGNSFSLPSKGGVLQPKMKSGFGVFKTSQKAQFYGLDDKWNKCEIIVMGDEYVIHKLNGEIVNMAFDLAIDKGPIAFEAETGEIFWRNIQIKEFSKSVPIIEFLCFF